MKMKQVYKEKIIRKFEASENDQTSREEQEVLYC
jgi:ribosomal protein S15P/S13E